MDRDHMLMQIHRQSLIAGLTVPCLMKAEGNNASLQ